MLGHDVRKRTRPHTPSVPSSMEIRPQEALDNEGAGRWDVLRHPLYGRMLPHRLLVVPQQEVVLSQIEVMKGWKGPCIVQRDQRQQRERRKRCPKVAGE